MPEARLTLKVRPFEKMIDSEGGPVSLRCTGSIEDELYVFQVGQSVHRLKAVSIGSDKWGPFAMLEPSEVSLGSGLKLTIEPEPEELEPGSPLGCRIGLTTRRDPAIVEELLRSQGIDPTLVNVLDPPEAAVAIHFHQSGQCTGWSGTYRAANSGNVRH